MKEESLTAKILKRFLKLFFISVIIMVGCILICLAIGKASIDNFSSAFTIAGVVVLVVGTFSITGTHKTLGDVQYQLARSVSNNNYADRMKQDFEMIDKGYDFFIYTAVISAILFLCSVIIPLG